MISPQEALIRLREGNGRFVSGIQSSAPLSRQTRRSELVEGQQPFAIVLGCSDSRAPVELVFDQDLGDLFVVRLAGNIVGPSAIGSIEFAAERFGTPLVVVLGHSRCGAVTAAVAEIRQATAHPSRHVRSILERLRPSVEPLLATELRHDTEALVGHAVRANVHASTHRLRADSEILERLVQKGELIIMGAEYSLETGVVDFLDDLPETS